MVRNFLVFLLFLCSSLDVSAQFTDSTVYFFGYTFTGSINKTQDGDANLLNNAVKLGMKKKSISMNFNNTYIYGKQNRQLSNDDITSSFDINLYKTFPHFNYWGLATFNKSFSLKVNQQWLAGLGVAYSIIDRKTAYLNLSDGLLVDHSDLVLEDGMQEKYETLRNSFRINYNFVINDLIIFNGSNFIQNSLSNKNDFIIKSTNRLGFKLNKWLNLNSQLDYNRVNRNSRENLLLSYGLSFERYF
jgi:hypothetical protein